jgi:hypothetical protein
MQQIFRFYIEISPLPCQRHIAAGTQLLLAKCWRSIPVMKFRPSLSPLVLLSLAALAGCSSIDVTSGHLRNNTPRYTTFTTESPQAMTDCIDQRWGNAGRLALTRQKTETGFALLTVQKLDTHEKQPMVYIAIDKSREGSSVKFYTNHIDDMADRSMVTIIQGCH